MSVSYKKLWKFIIDKEKTNVEVRKVAHVGTSTFSKKKKINMLL